MRERAYQTFSALVERYGLPGAVRVAYAERSRAIALRSNVALWQSVYNALLED